MARYSKKGIVRAERVVMFAEHYLRHTKDKWAGQAFKYADFQKEKMIYPVYGRLDRAGNRKTKRALFGIPRYNGKTEFVSSVHGYHMFGEPVYGGEQYAVAPTKKQAALTFESVKRMIQANPQLDAMCKIYRSVIEVRETGCTFQTLAFDADTAQGFHASFVTLDEIHAMNDLSMVEAMLSGMVGRDEGLLVAITTAGERPGGPEAQLMERWKNDPGSYIYWQGADPTDDAHDPKVWKKANPAPWITDAQLLDQYNSNPLASFERYTLNRIPCAAGSNRAFRPDDWAECGEIPILNTEDPCILAIDVGTKHDRTTIVLDQRDDDGYHNVKAFLILPDYEGESVDFEEIKDQVRHLCNEFNVSRIVCDPWQMQSVLNELQREGLPVEDFPQHNNRMAPAAMGLFDLIKMGRIRHGNDPVLTEHVLNAGVKEVSGGWKIIKVSDADKIDAAVALTMATRIAEQEAENMGDPVFCTG